MKRVYVITYKKVLKLHEYEIEATSKYDAKKRFYRLFPRYEIVSVREKGECEDGEYYSVPCGSALL